MIYMKILYMRSSMYGKAISISWSNQPPLGFPKPRSSHRGSQAWPGAHPELVLNATKFSVRKDCFMNKEPHYNPN
eukprot:SAG22_NODE_4415_length_1277_cov_3.286078_2_plen_75_part_00